MKILYLEDDLISIEFFVLQMERRGATVQVVRTLAAARHALLNPQTGADVFVADLTVTGGGAHSSPEETIELLATVARTLPCVALSGHRPDRYRKACLAAGVMEYVDKLGELVRPGETVRPQLWNAIEDAILKFHSHVKSS